MCGTIKAMMDGLKSLRLNAEAIPEGRCLAGFSGGADSTALVYLLAEERKNRRILPEVIHVNHGLRGKAAEEDEDFCRSVCRELDIPFHAVRIELAGRKDEKACREARFYAFQKCLRDLGIQVLVLAHNRDDLAETFLMRLMRGAGLEGLDCMSGKDTREGFIIIRPLLEAGRNEIRNALQYEGISWREDASNLDSAYLRNDIRKRLIPLMEEIAIGSSERIARTAGILTEENRMLQQEAEKITDCYSKMNRLDAEGIKTLPQPMQIRVLRTWWKRNAPERKEHSLNARQTQELAGLMMAERGKINLPGGNYAIRGRNTLYLAGFPERENTVVPYEPNAIRLRDYTLKTVPSEGNPGDGIRSQEIPEGFADGCVLRTRRPGDRIRPFGMNGSRKLQDYLTDRKIDEPWRNSIPLLCRGNEVLLAAGVGAGAIPLWRPDRQNVRLVWCGEFPWSIMEREEKY